MTKYDGLIECSYKCMYKLEKLEMLTFSIHDAHGTDVAK